MPVNTTTERRALGQRHEIPRSQKKTGVVKVGFYGCVGEVVRLQGTDYFPTNIRIHCPACGHFHIVRPFWRKWIVTLDASKPPQMVLEARDTSADL